MTKRKLTVIGLALAGFLCALVPTSAQDERSLQRLRREINTKTLPFTNRLPAVDRVELALIGDQGEMGSIKSIAAVKTVEGAQARSIASLWRSQTFDHQYSAGCHEPPYAIKFFSEGKVVLYASICWACSNIVILAPKLAGQGFDSKGRAGKALLRVFSEAFPRSAQRSSLLPHLTSGDR